MWLVQRLPKRPVHSLALLASWREQASSPSTRTDESYLMIDSWPMHRPQRGFMIVLVAIMGLLDATTVHARRVSAQVAVVRTAIAEVRGLRASLDWPEGADSGQLRIDIVRMAAPSLGYRFDQLRWQCEFKRDREGFTCAGPVPSAQGTMPALRL